MTVINNIKNFNNEKMNSIVNRINKRFEKATRALRNNKVETKDDIVKDILLRLEDIIHFVKKGENEELIKFYNNESHVKPYVLEKTILDLAVAYQLISNINIDVLKEKYTRSHGGSVITAEEVIENIARNLNDTHKADLIEALGCELEYPEKVERVIGGNINQQDSFSYYPTVEELYQVYKMIQEFTISENTLLRGALKKLLNILYSANSYLYVSKYE